MKLTKQWLIGGVVGIATVIGGLSYGGYRYYSYSKAEQLVLAYESVAFPNIFINQVDVAQLTKEEITSLQLTDYLKSKQDDVKQQYEGQGFTCK